MSTRTLLTEALLAGAAGTVALRAFVELRNRVRGQVPPYAARHITARLASSVFHRELSPLQARRWGATLRAVYGPLLGAAWATVRELTPAGNLPRGLLLGASVLAFELATFPVVRATTPLRDWSTADYAWLATQTAVYGLTTEATLNWLGR